MKTLTTIANRTRALWEKIPASLHLPLAILFLLKLAVIDNIDNGLANLTLLWTQVAGGLVAYLIFRSRRSSNVHQFSLENAAAGLLAGVVFLVVITIAGLWIFELELLPRLLMPIWIYLLVQASAYAPKADPRFVDSLLGARVRALVTSVVRKRMERSGELKPGQELILGASNRAAKRAAKKGKQVIIRQRTPR